MGYSFRLLAKVLLYASSHRQDNTYHGLCYTSRGALAGTRNSSMSTTIRIHLSELHKTRSKQCTATCLRLTDLASCGVRAVTTTSVPCVLSARRTSTQSTRVGSARARTPYVTFSYQHALLIIARRGVSDLTSVFIFLITILFI